MRTKTRNLSLIILAIFAFAALLFGVLFTQKSETAHAAGGEVEMTYDGFTPQITQFDNSSGQTKYLIAYEITLTYTAEFTDNSANSGNAWYTNQYNYEKLCDYILINGQSLTAIKADASLATTYKIPSAFIGDNWYEGRLSRYGWTPVSVEVAKNKLSFQIDRRYVAPTDLEITLKAGWRTTNGGTTYVINEDISYRFVATGVETVGIVKASEYSVQDADVTYLSAEKRADSGNYSVVWLKLPTTFASEGYGNGTWTMDHHKYLKDYMMVNGKPITWWNTATYSAEYDYSSALNASITSIVYRIPIMSQIYSTADDWVIAFQLNKDWLTAQGFTVETLTFGLRAGMPFVGKDGSTVYKTTSDITAQYRGNNFYEVREFKNGGAFTNKNASSLNENQCLFELNAPADYGEIAWHTVDWPNNQDFQNYIYINGKSMADINKTDTSGWAWNGQFANGALRYPIIVYISSTTMQIYIHPSYMAKLAEEQGSTGYNVDITVEVKEGGTLYDATNKIVYSVPAFAKDDVLKRKYTLHVLADGVNETTREITRGEKITGISPANKTHYDFVKWVDGSGADVNIDDLVMPANDYTVKAVFEAKTYTVTFMADGQQVGDPIPYTVENTTITPPAVPAKDYYNGAWASYTLDGGNKTVHAIYTAIEYTVTFKVEGEDYATRTYTVDNIIIDEPAVPAKQHYNGAWEAYTLTGGNKTVNAQYTAIEYTVTFKNGSQVVATETYTMETVNPTVTTPAVPAPDSQHEGGAWKVYDESSQTWVDWANYTLNGGDVVVQAIYTAKLYQIIFKADGEVVETVTYTADDPVNEPAVPAKLHYDGAWETYVKEYTQEQVVNAVYTPTVYTVTFKNGSQVVATRTYTMESANPTITAPAVPEKAHYTGAWEAYTLNGGNKTVNAVYTAIEYTVTFMADGEVVATRTYTVESTSITAPDVPDKEGYTGEWEAYELNGGNKTVNAVYTEIPAEGGCGGTISVAGAVLMSLIVVTVACVVFRKKEKLN